jgi:hypothetical protein
MNPIAPIAFIDAKNAAKRALEGARTDDPQRPVARTTVRYRTWRYPRLKVSRQQPKQNEPGIRQVPDKRACPQPRRGAAPPRTSDA